jgi:hypothetical protein
LVQGRRFERGRRRARLRAAHTKKPHAHAQAAKESAEVRALEVKAKGGALRAELIAGHSVFWHDAGGSRGRGGVRGCLPGDAPRG